jgi:hypothetical protein
MSGIQWKFMGGAPLPVTPKANPPQTNTITGTQAIRNKMNDFFKIENMDCIPHSKVPKPSIMIE